MTLTTVTSAPTFAMVPFRDTDILAARLGEEVRVPMKRFCGSIGLPWDGQRQRIERTDLLREGASMMLVPSEGGEQQQMTLPLGLLPGFLVGVSTNRLKPEARERLTLFQREAYEVLFRHFFGAPAAPQPIVARAPATPSWQELDAARRAAPALIAAIAAETKPSTRRYLYALLIADAERLGLPVPPLKDIGADGDSPDELVQQLVDGLDILTSRRAKWNHLGDRANGRMAIVLEEVERHFVRHDIDVVIDDALRAALRAGTRRWRIQRQSIESKLTRQKIRAIVISVWPHTGEAEAC